MIAIPRPCNHPAPDWPSSRDQARDVVRRWPHLERTSSGGKLTDTLADLINRAARETT